MGLGDCEELLEAVREWFRDLDREESSAAAATWEARTRNTRRRGPRRSGPLYQLPEPNPPRPELPGRPKTRSLWSGQPPPPLLAAPGIPESSKVRAVGPRPPPEPLLPVPREKPSHLCGPSVLTFLSFTPGVAGSPSGSLVLDQCKLLGPPEFRR